VLNHQFIAAGEQVFIIIVLVIISIVISGIKKALERAQQPPPRRPPPGGGARPGIPGAPQKQPGDQELREFLKNLAQGRVPQASSPKPKPRRPARPVPRPAGAGELPAHKYETVAEHVREVSMRRPQHLDLDEDVMHPLDERKPLVEDAQKKPETPYRFKARPKKPKGAPRPRMKAEPALDATAKAKAAAWSPAMAKRPKAAPIARGDVGLIESLPPGLTPMQRAIALTEILGVPPAFREGVGGYPLI